MRIIGIIPARYASTRLPGKPLADLNGQTLIERVWRRACAAKGLDRVLVATDDTRIRDTVEAFGGEAVMTPKTCASGTDRLAWVARRVSADAILNIQGDEPFVLPSTIDRLAQAVRARGVEMATVSAPLPLSELNDPNVVKVVCDAQGRALYFSRAAIPHARDGLALAPGAGFRLHVGLYAYRRDFLLRFSRWPQGRLERIEQLEQLRALEHGVAIQVVPIARPTLSIDTPADLATARRLLATRSSGGRA